MKLIMMLTKMRGFGYCIIKCQHLEDMQNSGNQRFQVADTWVKKKKKKKHAWVKDLLKEQDRTMDFNVTDRRH